MQKQYIWSLDISLHQTGVAIFEENGTPVKVCSVATKDKDATGLRLKNIAEYVLDLREKFPPKIVVMERTFTRFHTATAMLYRVHGVCQMLLWDCLQVYLTPKEIKSVVLRGNATKTEIQEKLRQKFVDINYANEDESDAFACGVSFLIKGGLLERW